MNYKKLNHMDVFSYLSGVSITTSIFLWFNSVISLAIIFTLITFFLFFKTNQLKKEIRRCLK